MTRAWAHRARSKRKQATALVLAAVALAAAFFLIALLFAAVGQAGASGYIAVMAIAGFAPAAVKTTALALAETKVWNEEVTLRAIFEGGAITSGSGRFSVSARSVSIRRMKLPTDAPALPEGLAAAL